LNRDLMSIPHSIFSFIDKHESQIATWWPSARNEFRAMAYVTPLMRADLGSPLAATVFGTDAMGSNARDAGGFGIVGTVLDHETLLRTFEASHTPGFTVSRLSGDMSGLRHPERSILATKPFTLLPATLFSEATKWTDICSGRWTHEDHITLGEGRAVVRLAQILAREPGAFRHKFLSLQDNMPCAGAFAKGRSVAVSLNHLMRRKASSCLAACLQSYLPWVESSKQPADHLSRIQDDQ
jgi:hypothetical protein